MEELSYSFHLSNDKNKTIKAKQEALNSPSGTTSKNNNAIQNIKHLGKVNHHNLRQYDNKTELITTIKGSQDIIKDVKDLYLYLFDEARINYNNKQVRDDRKIDDYFYKISNDDKHDLACEIIIEIGNMAYWEDKSLEEKTNYLISHLKKVLKKLPEFIQNIVDKMFDKNYSLFSFKHDYDPDTIAERNESLEKERKKERERKKQYSYDYYDEEQLEKDNDDGMEI